MKAMTFKKNYAVSKRLKNKFTIVYNYVFEKVNIHKLLVNSGNILKKTIAFS